jgi:membrane-associated phospholipid phosphatase
VNPSKERQPIGFLGRFGASAVAAVSAALLAAVLLAALIFLARAHTGAVHNFDVRTESRLNSYLVSHRWQIGFWKTVTTVGSPTTVRVAAAVVALGLCLRRSWDSAALIVTAMAGAAVLSGVTKLAVSRMRPVVKVPVAHVTGHSFPSGHALTSLVGCGVLLVLALPRLSAVLRLLLIVLSVGFVTAVGFSRLILGVHFPTDVLGGWLIGALWLAAVGYLFNWLPVRRWRGWSGRRPS